MIKAVEDRTREAGWNLKSVQVGTLITSAILLVGSLFFRSVQLTLGVFAGAFLAFINFIVLKRIVVKMTSETSQGKILPGLLSLFKFTLLAGVVFILLYSKQIDPIGLVIGLSSIVITLTLMAVVKLF